MKQYSILGRGCEVIGRGSRDRVRRVSFNRSGVRVDTIKGKAVVWYFRAPLSLLRFISNI